MKNEINHEKLDLSCSNHKKERGVIVFLVCIFIFGLCLYYFFPHKIVSQLDEDYKKNTVGNDTNNIFNNGSMAKQDEWIYYSLYDDGLYISKVDGSNKTKIVSGYISDINVIGEWIYYVKAYESKDIYYFDVYRIKLDGTKKEKIKENCVGLNIINDKLYCTVDVDYLGELKDRKLKFPKEEIGTIYQCDLEGQNCEKIVERNNSGLCLIKDNDLFYSNDKKLYNYNLLDKSTNYITESPRHMYLSNNTLYYLDEKTLNEKEKHFFKYDLNTKQISEVAVVNDNNLNEMIFFDNKIIYANGHGNTIKVIDVNDLSISEFFESGNMYVLDNELYFLELEDYKKIDSNVLK